jgi:hypothetical protein
MSRTVRRYRFWLVPLSIVAAIAISFCSWQRLQAQGPMPGGGMASGVPQAAAPVAVAAQSADAVLSLSGIVTGKIGMMNIKNWDGTVTQLLRFKYPLSKGRLITVQLPAAYKIEKRTKNSWETLFQVYAMDYESMLDAKAAREQEMAMSDVGEALASIMGGSAPSGLSQLGQAAGMPSLTGAPPGSGGLMLNGLGSTVPGGFSLPPMPMALPGMF